MAMEEPRRRGGAGRIIGGVLLLLAGLALAVYGFLLMKATASPGLLLFGLGVALVGLLWPLAGGAIAGGTAVGLVGLALTWGGVLLLQVGGSAYYLIAGVALLVVGVLLALRRAAAGWLYAAVLAGTVIWALAEAGFRFWPLLPRLAGPGVLGLVVTLTLLAVPRERRRGGAAIGAALLSSLATLAVLLAAVPGTFTQGQASGPGPVAAASPALAAQPADWRYYGRDPGGARFGPNAQITPANVGKLKLAWTARTGEPQNKGSEDQNTPAQIGDTLYTCTPTDVVIAFDADTGKERWRHDPKVKPAFWNRCRGVGVWESAKAKVAAPGLQLGPCERRIINTTIDGRMYALDAASGLPCAGFGANGVVDLKARMGQIIPSFYQPTSTPTVAGDRIIVGGWVTDNVAMGEPSGVVRAFDADTGALVWAWDIGNPNAVTAPADYVYTRGTPNVWSTPAFDPVLNLVYLPTGNATPDYWGSHRSAKSDEYNSSIVALDIATGAERWKFQTTHHDVWDYDVPAQPMLIDFPVGAGATPAVVALTKRGQVFVLDRATGKPLSPVAEKPAPQGFMPGEWSTATQPYSPGMPTLQADRLTEAKMWGISPLDQLTCRIAFRRARYDGDFTPPGSKARPGLQYPGNGGGQNWGTGAWDPTRQLLITSGIRQPQTVWLERVPETGMPIPKGSRFPGMAPSSGPMAPLDQRSPQSRNAVRYVSHNTAMLGPALAPCLEPPHGVLQAIDLRTRKVVWQVPMGTAEQQGPFALASHLPIPIGTFGLGGPIATAGGVVFHAATTDPYLRAYDVATGKVLWKGRLPAGVGGTPMTYVSSRTGKAYVAVSASGARLVPGPKGDYVIAFTLP